MEGRMSIGHLVGWFKTYLVLGGYVGEILVPSGWFGVGVVVYLGIGGGAEVSIRLST